ncbi:MAG: aspartate-semialdehyde dehydrogenase family protein [Candidatus Acidiferrales bacterium]
MTVAKRTRVAIEVGILGATGMVGQQFVALLGNHPWFRVTWLGASERSAGRRYGELPWRLPAPLADGIGSLPVETPAPGRGPRLVFSALDASVAGEAEAAFAAAGHVVVSNARNHRMDPLVPLLVPEINPEHLALIPQQRRQRGWSGAIVTNPNCSTVFLALALAALRDLEPERVLVTTMQALSGAGYPGVASLDALGNVIPYIAGEEEKIETETQKILGRLAASSAGACPERSPRLSPASAAAELQPSAGIRPHPVRISAQANRVPVANGHTEAVSIEFREPRSREEILAAVRVFAGKPQSLDLPSAPAQPLVYLDGADRPQPRLDVERLGGMAVCAGRLRPCPVLGWKFVLLGHNTIRGAAGAAILNAELMAAEGWLD